MPAWSIFAVSPNFLLCGFGPQALLLIYGHTFLPPHVMRGLGLYLDPALSIVLSLAIAAAAWPVGKMAVWTLLEGAPVEAEDLKHALGKVAVVEACALLHLRDDPVDRAGLVHLRLRRGDKRRRMGQMTNFCKIDNYNQKGLYLINNVDTAQCSEKFIKTMDMLG